MLPLPIITFPGPFPSEPTLILIEAIAGLIIYGLAGATGGVINLGEKAGNVTVGAAGLVSGDFLLTVLGVIPALNSNETIGSFLTVLLANP